MEITPLQFYTGGCRGRAGRRFVLVLCAVMTDRQTEDGWTDGQTDRQKDSSKDKNVRNLSGSPNTDHCCQSVSQPIKVLGDGCKQRATSAGHRLEWSGNRDLENWHKPLKS